LRRRIALAVFLRALPLYGQSNRGELRRFQVDGQNLTNLLNANDFGGLFSGNAMEPSRSYAPRLVTRF
jgi:hypothetical protein